MISTEKPLVIADLTIDLAFAREYISWHPNLHHIKESKWQDVKIKVTI